MAYDRGPAKNEITVLSTSFRKSYFAWRFSQVNLQIFVIIYIMQNTCVVATYAQKVLF